MNDKFRICQIFQHTPPGRINLISEEISRTLNIILIKTSQHHILTAQTLQDFPKHLRSSDIYTG